MSEQTKFSFDLQELPGNLPEDISNPVLSKIVESMIAERYCVPASFPDFPDFPDN